VPTQGLHHNGTTTVAKLREVIIVSDWVICKANGATLAYITISNRTGRRTDSTSRGAWDPSWGLRRSLSWCKTSEHIPKLQPDLEELAY